MGREGEIIMKDGRRISSNTAADWIGTSVRQVDAAKRAVGCSYEDIKECIKKGEQKRSPRPGLEISYSVARLDPKDVYELGKYSKGQRNHRTILMQLLGLTSADKESFDARFPDA